MEKKPGPLHGVTVLDVSWYLAGPFATRVFADMGATVIKIERYKDGTSERGLPLLVEHRGVAQSSYHINCNRGKKSVCINLQEPQGLQVMYELIKQSDIILENYAPGVMQRLGLDYEAVRKVKDDIIYCSISCFGHWGPYAEKPGFDLIAQAASGWTDQSVQTQSAPVSIGDMNAAVHATTAVLAALYCRKKTGRGQRIDISMMDCLFSLHENTLPWYLMTSAIGKPVDMPRIGSLHPGYAPYGIYKARDGNITIACLTQPRWEGLLAAMGKDYAWLRDDPRATDVSTRCTAQNAPFIHKVISEWVLSHASVMDVERKLEEKGVPCVRARSLKELADDDPHVQAREMMVAVEQPFIGSMKMCGSPFKMSASPCGIAGYAPFLGEHNSDILTHMLGYSAEKVSALYGSQVLYHEPAVEKLQGAVKPS